MTTLRLIGYWRPEIALYDNALRSGDLTPRQIEYLRTRRGEAEASPWPDPRAFIDPTWASSERPVVGEYLERGTLVIEFRGLSPCRICNRHNGSAELSDGVFCWPEGLAHYVKDHQVRLPDEFASHVQGSLNLLSDAPRPTFDELGQRDRSWPGSQDSSWMWAPRVKTDDTWWIAQTGDS